MRRTWDIIDKILPGVEITQLNERPVKFALPGSGFTLAVSAVMILATASAFCMPVPREAAIVSSIATDIKRSAEPPPLFSHIGEQSSHLTIDHENELLDKIELARTNVKSADALRLDVLELNQEESLKKSPSFNRAQIVGIVKKRRLG